jgi:pimeloyl-ACP methyl ester carboxylesterase
MGVTLVKAADGFPLAVERFSSSADGSSTVPPVVLCPGFGGNRYNFDLDESHSLARHLAREGFDVWIAELRGYGRSKEAGLRRRRGARGWNMDDHVEKDVPAVLSAVSKLSARPNLFWVGHSLGGMVAYCLLARYPEYARFFAGLITLGSPGHVERKSRLVTAPTALLLRALRRRDRLPTSPLIKILFSPMVRQVGLSRLWRHWLNPENMDQSVLDATMRLGLEDFSTGTLAQWVMSMRRQSLVSGDGVFDYFQNMERIDTPLLFIGGTHDHIAPAASLNTIFHRVRSSDKKLRVFGRQGFELIDGSSQDPRADQADYGHDDLLLGEASRSDIFPYIVDWLRERATA